MTTVNIRETKERIAIHLKGHAEYDGTGRDIVCASCSVLIQSLVNALCVMEIRNEWRQTDGEVELTFEKAGDWKGAYTVAVVGYSMLAASYPQNVTVKIDEGAG